MDADVLDPDQCYIRAKLSIVAKDTVTYIVDGINYTVSINNVHICGDKLPFTPCGVPTTKVLKFKFASAMDIPILIAANVGSYMWDMGLVAKDHPDYHLYFGWNKPVRTLCVDRLPELKDTREKILGTGVELNDEKDSWFILVPNGF